MSTGYECTFVRFPQGVYYLLQRWDCPVGAWDWREHADAFGPFQTAEQAKDHLRRNHANPGGYWEDTDNEREPDEVEARLIREAKR